MADKRTINGTKYNVAELVDSILSTIDNQLLNLEKASKSLTLLGHRNPDSATIARYARESVILDALSRETGANFSGQIGKIDFSNRERAIAGVEAYLNRRLAGQHARWTANHR